MVFSFVRYGPLWPCAVRGRRRAPVLDIPLRSVPSAVLGGGEHREAREAGDALVGRAHGGEDDRVAVAVVGAEPPLVDDAPLSEREEGPVADLVLAKPDAGVLLHDLEGRLRGGVEKLLPAPAQP